MAHDKCIGTWNMKLGGSSDGQITIDSHTSSTFTGTHHNTGASLENTNCTGDEISFERKDGNKKIKYKKGALSNDGETDFVKGKFEKVDTESDSGVVEQKAKNPAPESDDWTGDKTGT